MAKQRKEGRGNFARERKHPSIRQVKPKAPFLEQWNNKVAMFVAFNIIVVILSVVYLFYQNHLENIVITPIRLPKVVGKDSPRENNMFWGTYRPGAYFGMRTRSPQTIATGLMWFTQKIDNHQVNIRHWCDQGDSVKHYSWYQHDGENFGVQKIQEEDYVIGTSFIKNPGGKHGGDYTVKISVLPDKVKTSNSPIIPVSLMFYVWGTTDADLTPYTFGEGHLQKIHGLSSTLGNFTVHFREMESSKAILKYNYLSAEAPTMAHLKETVLRNQAIFHGKERQLQILGLIGNEASFVKKSDKEYKPNFIVYQVTFLPPFELEVYFESKSFHDRPRQIVGGLYSVELTNQMKKFEEKFERTFKLSKRGYVQEDIRVAWSALSNMIGGIGYFYGSSLVQSSHNKEPISYWNAPLYSSVPSRSFFPRGFLWDEGFHNLLILEWNPEITKDIIGHWLDLLNVEGWIPREQILGPEARERVPTEFIVQKNTNGNPPAFFLTLEKLLEKMERGVIPKDKDFMKLILPRLKAWFDWFEKSQVGVLRGTYRWRGRVTNSDRELNPKTLTSGLDDFPRASHPTFDERHLDLRCWIAFAAGVLADIGDFVDEPMEKYRQQYLLLTDNKELDELHWSPKSNSYSDYGFHSASVKLVKDRLPQVPGSFEPPQYIVHRIVKEDPTLRFVDNFGYISLFPFLLKIIDSSNPKLGHVLTDLKKPDLLWTKFGLRSLAKTSPYYLKYNTEHDPPYWRGSVWININFLAVRALKFYSLAEGPYKAQAKELYQELRTNVVNNIIRQYKETGYIWEQYDDKTGQGKGVHPFTGWSALFVLMMAENY